MKSKFTYSPCGKCIDLHGKPVLSVDPCGLYKNRLANRLALAKRLTRLLNHEQTEYVTIEVTGGVAEVTRCPKNINVNIIDHDNDYH